MFTEYLILALAVWRITSLFVYEEGPFHIFERFRFWTGVRGKAKPPYEEYGTNVVSAAIVCHWCFSVWVGMIWAVLYFILPGFMFFLSIPFALSAGAIIVETVIDRNS